MDLRLTNKVVFVTGSSRGIGKAIAHSFLNEGARVVISGRDKKTLSDTFEAFKKNYGSQNIILINDDLSSLHQIELAVDQVYKKWEHIDCLVANIGNGMAKAGWQVTQEDWANMFEVNLWGGIRITEKVLPGMIERKKGSIIFISSIAGIDALNAPITYSVAKTGIISYCKNLSKEIGKYGIRVNCVAPGNIFYEGGSWDKHMKQNSEAVNEYIRQEVPLSRFGKTDEIADIVTFLASERASFITGACVVADGGQTKSI